MARDKDQGGCVGAGILAMSLVAIGACARADAMTDAQVASPIASAPVAGVPAVPGGGAVTAEPCHLAKVLPDQKGPLFLMAAACGSRSIIVGEAVSTTTAWNAALSALLVVRQRPYRTSVSAVRVEADGSLRLVELTPVLQRELTKAGRVQAPMLAVDTGSFATTGAVAVAPVPSPAIKVVTPPPTGRVSVGLATILARGAQVVTATPASPVAATTP